MCNFLDVQFSDNFIHISQYEVFGTQFKSLTANKFAYKAFLEVFNTLHV